MTNEIEEAIEFGKKISGIDRLLGHAISVFGSTVWSDNMKRSTAADLDSHRKFVQDIIAIADSKYPGIKVAEEAKNYAQQRLAELEIAAKPYLA
jgi:hypothetical protein